MAFIGYVTSGNIGTYPYASLGDYVFDEASHNNGEWAYFIIQGTESSAPVTNSSGDALFTVSGGHGLVDGDWINIKDTRNYFGNFYVDSLTSTTFKVRKRASAGYKAFVSGETVTISILNATHNQKNFSVGVGSDGYSRYQDYLLSSNTADLVGSNAYNNHATDGRLKYTLGGSGNYTGPIGNRIWLVYRDHNVTISNSGGTAIFTSVGHGLVTSNYVMLKNSNNFYGQHNVPYSGYYYVNRINNDTFTLKTRETGTTLTYNGNPGTVKYSLTVGACKMSGLDVCGSSASTVTITNAEGQFIGRKQYESTANYGWEWFGTGRYVKCTGRYHPLMKTGYSGYTGHDSGYKYSYGRYGIWFQFYNELSNNPMLYITDGADEWELEHIEVDGGTRGFAGLMMKTDNKPFLRMNNINVHDCYFHDMEGEGCYIGNTGNNTPDSPALQHWVKLFFYNNRVVRTGVEIIQTGQLQDGTYVENNVAYLGTLTHMAPFFLGQSNGQQHKPIGNAETYTRNNIVMGFTANGILIQHNRANEAKNPNKSLIVENSVYHYGRQRWMYYDGPEDGVMPYRYKNIYMKSIVPFDSDRNESQATDYNEVILTTDTITEVYINDLVLDTSMNSRTLLVKDGVLGQFNVPHLRTGSTVPDVEFVRSGYEGLNILNVHAWFAKYNPTHPTHGSQFIIYTTNDIVLYLGEHFKCNTTHSGATTPPTSVNWTKMYWDVNGYHSFHGSYNGTPYSTKPPDDYRLTANSFYNKLGIGLNDNQPNTDSTYIQWEYCYNNGGSPDTATIFNLPIVPNKEITKDEVIRKIGKNKYIRRKVTPIDTISRIGITSISDWYLVT